MMMKQHRLILSRAPGPGVYIGSDNGTWTVDIDAKGVITGQISSYINAMSLPIQGTVNNQGEFDATISTSTGNVFIGQLTETTASGNWENVTGGTGTWEGTKQ